MTSPLDALFRPTTAVPRHPDGTPGPAHDPAATRVPERASARSAALASAAPVRTTGTRTRAGNAMSRTRIALLSGAGLAVASSGSKIAMSQVAASAGVAKATLYNHFRTREAVLAALLAHEIMTLIEAADGKPLERALVDTAIDISRHPVRQGLAAVEPAALARLAAIDTDHEGWLLARTAVAAHLTRYGLGGADLVLRWLGSFLLSPASPGDIAADAIVLVAGLPAAPVLGPVEIRSA